MSIKLDDVKDQAGLDAAIESAVSTAVASATEGLAASKDKILGRLKKRDEELGKLEGLDVDSLIAAQAKLKEIESKSLEEQGEYKKLLEKAKEQHAQETADAANKLKSANDLVQTLLVHDGLSKELAVANVNPVLLDAAVRLLESDVAVVEEDGKRVARVGEQSLAEHVKKWAASDVGKNFVLASGNQGGGSNGGNGGNDVSEWDVHFAPKTANLTKQGELYKKDPTMYNEMKAKHQSEAQG